MNPLKLLVILLMIISYTRADWDANAYSLHSEIQPRTAEDLIKKIASEENVKNIWVLGSGCGRNIPLLLKQFPKARLTGNDPSVAMHEFAHQSFSSDTNVKLTNTSAQDFTSEETFDLVFSSYVLHWIPTDNLEIVFEKIHKHLNHDGVFAAIAISLKHVNHPLSAMNLHINRKYKDSLIGFKSSFTSHGLGELENLLTEKGFNVKELSFIKQDLALSNMK